MLSNTTELTCPNDMTVITVKPSLQPCKNSLEHLSKIRAENFALLVDNEEKSTTYLSQISAYLPGAERVGQAIGWAGGQTYGAAISNGLISWVCKRIFPPVIEQPKSWWEKIFDKGAELGVNAVEVGLKMSITPLALPWITIFTTAAGGLCATTVAYLAVSLYDRLTNEDGTITELPQLDQLIRWNPELEALCDANGRPFTEQDLKNMFLIVKRLEFIDKLENGNVDEAEELINKHLEEIKKVELQNIDVLSAQKKQSVQKINEIATILFDQISTQASVEDIKISVSLITDVAHMNLDALSEEKKLEKIVKKITKKLGSCQDSAELAACSKAQIEKIVKLVKTNLNAKITKCDENLKISKIAAEELSGDIRGHAYRTKEDFQIHFNHLIREKDAKPDLTFCYKSQQMYDIGMAFDRITNMLELPEAGPADKYEYDEQSHHLTKSGNRFYRGYYGITTESTANSIETDMRKILADECDIIEAELEKMQNVNPETLAFVNMRILPVLNAYQVFNEKIGQTVKGEEIQQKAIVLLDEFTKRMTAVKGKIAERYSQI